MIQYICDKYSSKRNTWDRNIIENMFFILDGQY